MRWIDDLPIRWKLVLITIVTGAIAALFTGAIITIYNANDYTKQKTEETIVQAKVLAGSLAAPLAFDDATAAQEYLHALSANQQIAAAGVYDVSRTRFATYARTEALSVLVPEVVPAGGPRFEGDKLIVSEPIRQSGNLLGTIYLVIDTEPFIARLARAGEFMLLAVLESLLVSVPISMGLNATITNPIQKIAFAAARIKAGNLNEPLPVASRADEIGMLMRVLAQMVTSLRETMQQDRLRALGQLASGVAHDISNAITPIALHTQALLEGEPNLSVRNRSYLEMVKRVIGDVTATVGRMRDFSRKRQPSSTLEPVDLNNLVQQVIELTKVRWVDMRDRHGILIDVRSEKSAGLLKVMGVDAEIREALTNLVFNAADAMPNGGVVTLRTRIDAISRQVCVEVSDTGIGMDEETKRRCFEPFFTTKGEQGTGLGLAMVHGVVQRHNAEIEIESVVGRGTTVRLTFEPCAVDVADADKKSALPVPTPLRILVVDDDLAVLDSMRVVLELDDHNVVTMPGGRAGIDAFHAAIHTERPFHIVITDLGMPTVDGRTVANALKASSPLTPIVLLTGRGEHMDDEPSNVDYILGKPPALDALRAILEEVARNLRVAAPNSLLLPC